MAAVTISIIEQKQQNKISVIWHIYDFDGIKE